MIIDIHTHIFPRAIREQRQRYFEGEPTFELLYGSPKSLLIGADQLVRMMDDAGVAQAVTFGFPWRSDDTFRHNNDYILDAVSRHPGRLIGFCCLDPLHPDAAAEVRRCLSAGLSGIGELAFYDSDLDQRCLESLDPIMALADQFNVPVMLHTNEPVGHAYPGKAPNTLARIYALVRRYPRNRLILAHWGGGLLFYALLKKEVRPALANVWFDTAASPYLYQPEIYTVAADIVGADKLLFGTDYPLLGPQRYLDEMRRAGLSAERMDRICGRNALEVLKRTP